MAKGPTIEEIKKARNTLESSITSLIKDFEKSTGVDVTYINIDRKRDAVKSTRMAPEVRPMKRGEIFDVRCNISFDEFY